MDYLPITIKIVSANILIVGGGKVATHKAQILARFTDQATVVAPDHSEEHFSFAPKDQFAALKYARSKGLKILANWHSHPASPSRPSQEDLRLANDPNIRYAILSLLDGKIHLNSFKVLNGEVVDKEVHFEQN
jgi:proteasome lid subunit RPN8/RPN11